MKCIFKEDFWEKMTLKKWRYFLKIYDFWQKIRFFIKNTTFELLDHHHELNQKKLILYEFFMFKIDSPMLKLWSIPSFFLHFLLVLDFCWILKSNNLLKGKALGGLFSKTEGAIAAIYTSSRRWLQKRFAQRKRFAQKKALRAGS